ncbi:ABC transporter ATP-binding protein [Herbiconiux sp. CPCC 205763]|uniref:ABC transporter ATP-binding protein n=1 Tax=Herbiconiux aconitum TaxID=2970913 RepID=A0ABT2GTZ2_9MICO|nr:ABC transporter ATP-binding protein [Herbiconiux aconitum]MCS5719682.1 ABC transporter ATP-binding protein [Herbiconiux aconitum]
MTTAAASANPLLRVDHLNVGFTRGGETRSVVKDVSFTLQAGECLAIVGESGSGKSVTARTIVGLTGANAVVEAETLELDGIDLATVPEKAWRGIRGRRVGFILQDALVSLDPLRPVGKEIEEALALHGWGSRAARKRKVVDLLESVGVPNAAVRARQRPDELSGGLRQRALIASALALGPELVIADEPTTALDVTVQAQVLDLIAGMKKRGVSVILISHDLSVVARLADHILVMKGGSVLESGSAHQVLTAPEHEYTQALIDAVPGGHTRGERLGPALDVALPAPDSRVPLDASEGPVLEARDLVKRFRGPGGVPSTAVDHVSFTLERGATLGIVGESGSGKSTTARIALALTGADEGWVKLVGQDWSSVKESKRRHLRNRIAVVYQDPLSSFDPRWTVERILVDAVGQADRVSPDAHARARDLLRQVGLTDEVLPRLPLKLSGGQRQRVAIARALATEPSIIVLDEAVSALDVSVQAQILDLLVELQDRIGLSYLFISHDLGVIHHMSDTVLVMKDGAVVERGTADDVFLRPQHPYTQELVRSLPTLEEPRGAGAASASSTGSLPTRATEAAAR